MPVDKVIDLLLKLSPILQIGAVIIALALLGIIAYIGYLFLSYGHKAFELALPYAHRLLEAILTERHKHHPAISVERYLHYFFGGIAILCISVVLLHALIPWQAHHMEFIAYVLVSCIVVCICIVPVSIYTALRL